MHRDATTGDRGSVSELPAAFAVNRHGFPETLFTLRQTLYRKAKQESRFRFYALYDRVYRLDVLEAAWGLVAHHGGAPGVDGVTIAQIVGAPGGLRGLVVALHDELRAKRYRPQQRRSQRPCRPPAGQSWYRWLMTGFGLELL